jgi:CubicO group peptidase (beta-lactamase class C family)
MKRRRTVARGGRPLRRGGLPPPVEETNRWEVTAPEVYGLDAEAFAAAEDHAEQKVPSLTGILVAHHGRIVLERYYRGGALDRASPAFSITKSFVSALVGIALRDRMLPSLNEKLVNYLRADLPGHADPRVSEIRLRDLLTMTAGFESGPEAFAGGAAASDRNLVQAILSRPMASAPGSRFAYDNGAAHLVSAVLTQATGMSAAAYASTELFRPLGIDEDAWWSADRQGNSHGAYGLQLTGRDLAKLGELYLRGGCWGERRLIPARYVRASTRRQVRVGGSGGGYGYLWWTHGARKDAPRFFAAAGYGGQFVVAVPEHDLVVVTTSNASKPPGREYRLLFRRVLATVRTSPQRSEPSRVRED